VARYNLNIEHGFDRGGSMTPLTVPENPPRGTRVRFHDDSRVLRLQGQVAYVAEHNQYGMFWVWVPALAEEDPAYARQLFGPYMQIDIGKGKIMALAPSRSRAPDLDKLLAPRFKRGRRS
jgi:hypothetical protein